MNVISNTDEQRLYSYYCPEYNLCDLSVLELNDSIILSICLANLQKTVFIHVKMDLYQI